MLTYALAVLAARAGMTTGLGRLRYLLAPSSGKQGHVHWYVRLAGIGLNLVLVGIAAGSTFGLTAALMKAMTITFAGGSAPHSTMNTLRRQQANSHDHLTT